MTTPRLIDPNTGAQLSRRTWSRAIMDASIHLEVEARARWSREEARDLETARLALSQTPYTEVRELYGACYVARRHDLGRLLNSPECQRLREQCAQAFIEFETMKRDRSHRLPMGVLEAESRRDQEER